MAKIQVINNSKTGQVKYQMILPKDVMEDFAVQQGDSLLVKSVVGNEITFRYKRNAEVKVN
jgi:antitoxin component of MazEF toxin-antitoxin module